MHPCNKKKSKSYDITQNKSYQATESGTSTVVTKVKGIGYTHYNASPVQNNSIRINQENFKIFDTSSKMIKNNT